MFEKEKVGNRIRELRKMMGLSQSVMGGLCNTSQAAIAAYESGRVAPGIEMLYRLSEKFGVSAQYLLGLTDDPHFEKGDMSMNEYVVKAQRTASTRTKEQKIENGLFGLCGEVGEIHDLQKKYKFQGHSFDENEMIKELGDVMWYVAELAMGLGVTLSDVADRNIRKLQERYPDGFDANVSKARYETD